MEPDPWGGTKENGARIGLILPWKRDDLGVVPNMTGCTSEGQLLKRVNQH
jgi:hypothetical protein